MVFSYRKWEFITIKKNFRMVVFDSQMKQIIISINTFLGRGLQTSGALPILVDNSVTWLNVMEASADYDFAG